MIIFEACFNKLLSMTDCTSKFQTLKPSILSTQIIIFLCVITTFYQIMLYKVVSKDNIITNQGYELIFFFFP